MKTKTTTQINPQLLTPSPELLELQPLMPISKDDRDTLTTDIRENGIRDAIKVYQDEDGAFFIIGGLNRWEIAKELGIEIVDIMIFDGTEKEIKELVINDNLSRRHLKTADKRALIGAKLELDPAKSNRKIARETGVDHKTVGDVRREKVKAGDIPAVEGRERVKPPTVKEAHERIMSAMEKNDPPATSKEKIKKVCPHCGGELV